MPVTIQKLGMGDDKIVKIILAVLSCMKLLKKWLLRLSPAVILSSKTFAKVLETVWKQVKFNGYITAMHSRKNYLDQSVSSLHFPAFRLNTKIYWVKSPFSVPMRNNTDHKNSKYRHLLRSVVLAETQYSK